MAARALTTARSLLGATHIDISTTRHLRTMKHAVYVPLATLATTQDPVTVSPPRRVGGTAYTVVSNTTVREDMRVRIPHPAPCQWLAADSVS